MQAYQGGCNKDSVNGKVGISQVMDNQFRRTEIHSGIFSKLNSWKRSGRSSIKNIYEYQVYGIDWNELAFQTFTNDQVIYQGNRKFDVDMHEFPDRNQDEYYSFPFEHPFNLFIHIGVNSFGQDLRNGEDNSELAWLEIENVTVYGDVAYNNELHTISGQTRNLYPVIIGITLLMIIMVILSIIFAYQWRRQKRKIEQLTVDQFYDDIGEFNENDKRVNEYEMINYDQVDLQQNEYLQVTDANFHQNNECNQGYMDM